MRNLYLCILVLLFAATAQAAEHRCVTRTTALEDRYTALCPTVKKILRNPTVWNDKKCATWFFEGGIRVLSHRVQMGEIDESRRVARCEANNRDLAEFENREPDDCSPPPPTPTPSPVPTPLP